MNSNINIYKRGGVHKNAVSQVNQLYEKLKISEKINKNDK